MCGNSVEDSRGKPGLLRCDMTRSGSALTRVLYGLLFLQVTLLVLGVQGQSCHVDEAWLGEQAYWEAKDGLPRQVLMSGMFHLEDRALVRHKLFISMGSLVTRFTGFDLYHLRTISLAAGLFLLWLIFWYMRGHEEGNRLAFLFSVTVLLSCPLAFRYMKIYRPEYVLAAFGFLGFFLLCGYIQRNRLSDVVLSGVFAGAAALAHMNGIIFILAGFGVLIRYRRWNACALFGALSVGIAALYFYDVVGNFDLFRLQFFNDFTVDGTRYGFTDSLLRLVGEHMRYFRTPEIIGISSLFAISLPAAVRGKVGRTGPLPLYLLLLFVFLGITAKSVTTKYAIPLLPFFTVVIGLTFSGLIRGGIRVVRWYRNLLFLFLFVYVGYGVYCAVNETFMKRTNTVRENARIARSMERGARILAPTRFVFDEIEHYDIRDLFAARYLIMHAGGTPFNLTSLCEYARNHQIRYMVIDPKYRSSACIDPRRMFPPVWGYEVVKVYTDGTLLLREYKQDRIQPNS